VAVVGLPLGVNLPGAGLPAAMPQKDQGVLAAGCYTFAINRYLLIAMDRYMLVGLAFFIASICILAAFFSRSSCNSASSFIILACMSCCALAASISMS
jgi:hypothetical protein